MQTGNWVVCDVEISLDFWEQWPAQYAPSRPRHSRVLCVATLQSYRSLRRRSVIRLAVTTLFNVIASSLYLASRQLSALIPMVDDRFRAYKTLPCWGRIVISAFFGTTTCDDRRDGRLELSPGVQEPFSLLIQEIFKPAAGCSPRR